MALPDLLATPRDTDLAWSIVTTVLPMGGEETAFSVGLGVLAAGLVFLATLWLGWWIVSGITQAAYSGKPFAEGTHGIWAPLRIVVGFGMLVPAVGGLPTVEYVLRDLVVRSGVNLANAVALRSAQFVVKDGHPLSPISIGGAGLVRDIVESEVCAAAVLAGRDNAADTSRPSASLPSPAGSPVVRPAQEAWWPWGESMPAATTGFSWSWGSACGSLSVSSAAEFGDGSFGEVRRQAISRVISETRAMPFVKALADAVRGIGTDSALPTDAALDVARQRGQLGEALAAEFKWAGGIYDRAIASAAADVAKASTDRATLRAEVLRDIEERGFMALASYYRVLAGVSLATAEAAAERPVRVGPDPKAWGVYEGEASRALAFLDTQFRRESAAEVLASGEIGEATAEATNVFGDMLSATTDPLRDYLISYDGFRADPIADLADMGGRLLVGSEAGYAIVLAAYGTSSLFMGAGQGALDAVMVPGWPLLGSLYVVGAVLAYVLPSIPYYLMWFAFGAFTLEFATASIAVLAWAFVHVRPDGQEFVSQAQRHGYGQLLVGLFMRLPATVLAFIVGQMVLVTLLNAFLASYSVSVQGNAFGRAMGVTGLVVSFGMMLYIQWQLILWSFKLITSIPERLGAWFGITVSSWGEGEAGTHVVGGVWSSQRNLPSPPKPAGGKGGAHEKREAKGGTPLGASAGGAPPSTPSS